MRQTPDSNIKHICFTLHYESDAHTRIYRDRWSAAIESIFQKNWNHYLQESLGLAIFMISACFFGALLEGKNTYLHELIRNDFLRRLAMGLLMGSTTLFIFYSPCTSPSGSHINPAVTISFWRLGKMCHWDACFYIVFQFIGGTLAVYGIQFLAGKILIAPPVNSVVTIPGKAGIWSAFFMEFGIAFITMTMVLFTSSNHLLKKYTRPIAGGLVCMYVIVAGPVSGFGMNPARSFASALPAHNWTAAWIYLVVPVISMLIATEIFILIMATRKETIPNHSSTEILNNYSNLC